MAQPTTENQKLDQILAQNDQMIASQQATNRKVDRVEKLLDGDSDMGVAGIRPRLATVEVKVTEFDEKLETKVDEIVTMVEQKFATASKETAAVASSVTQLTTAIATDKQIIAARVQGMALGIGLLSGGGSVFIFKVIEGLFGGGQ